MRDAEGDWPLSGQSGYEAVDFDRMPSATSREQVVTNGFSCSCIRLQVETEVRGRNGLVRRVISDKIKPLVRCRRDPRLPAITKGNSRP